MSEKRQHKRVESSESAVVVELRFASPTAPEEGRTIFCSTSDVSTHGLRLRMKRPIAVDTPLRITVIFSQPSRHFEHVGVVRWCDTGPSGEEAVGIEFLPKNAAAMQEWSGFLLALFPDIYRGMFNPV
jgi:hypothetical protein